MTDDTQSIYDIPGVSPSQQPQGEEPEQQSAPPVQPPAEAITYLNLNDQQKAWLIERACNRIDECRTKMGLVFGQGIARTGSWAWDRQIAQMQYDGVYEWRRNVGGVFLENNWSMNVPKRFIRLMTAKVCADLLGTEPYFAAMPEKAQDAALSKAVEKYLQDEIADSNYSEMLREAVRVAITCGERAVKLSHVKDQTFYTGPAVVAVDQQQPAQPIVTPGGHHIFPKDDFVANQDSGQVRLKKDPSYVLSKGHQHLNPITGKLDYQRVNNLQQTITHKDGLEAGGISCEDFIYPIDVSSLDKADIMVHVYDDTLEALQMAWGDKSDNPRFNISPTGPLSKASQPIEQQGEQPGCRNPYPEQQTLTDRPRGEGGYHGQGLRRPTLPEWRRPRTRSHYRCTPNADGSQCPDGERPPATTRLSHDPPAGSWSQAITSKRWRQGDSSRQPTHANVLAGATLQD